MVLEICAIAAVVIFAALVIWLILTLQTARKFMVKTEETLVGLSSQVNAVSKEVIEILHTTQGLTQDIQAKAHALDSLFHSVKDVGETVQMATGSVKRIVRTAVQTASSIEQSAQEQQGKFAQVGEVIGASLKLWQSFKSHRNEKLLREQYIKGADPS